MAHKGATRGRNKRQKMSSPHLFLALLLSKFISLSFQYRYNFFMRSKMVTISSGAERCIQDIGEDRGRLDLTAGEVLFQHYVDTTFISSSAGCVCRFSSSRASFTSSTSTDGQTVGPLQPLLSPGRAAPDTLISYIAGCPFLSWGTGTGTGTDYVLPIR